MTLLLVLACSVAVQVSGPFESRQPEARARMLEYGGGSAETDAAVTRAIDRLVRAQTADGS